MTFRRIPRAPSKRSIAAYAAFASGRLEEMPKAVKPRKTGRQKESLVNDAVIKVARLHGATLYRNRRGMVRLEHGGMFPYGLGPNGYPDLVGYKTITITPDMVSKRIAVYVGIESKRADKAKRTADDHQEDQLTVIRAAGGIAGVCRSAEEAEELLR